MDELLSRQMPHSTEAEQSVLGAMLIDENCIPLVIEQLRPEDFYLSQNRALYAQMYDMFNFSRKIDLVTLLEQMRRSGQYDERSSRAYIQQLMEITPTAANVRLYIEIVQDKSLLRRLSAVGAELTDQVGQGLETGSNLLEVAERRLYDLRKGSAREGLVPIGAIVPALMERLGELFSGGQALPGLSSGISTIDSALMGFNPSDLVILAARPGMGKTSLALNIALHAGKTTKKEVAIFSLEMSKEQLGMRLLGTEARVHNQTMTTGKLSDDDWVRVAVAAQNLTETKLLIDDNSTITVTDINAKCRRLKNLGLVVVDYLQLISSAGGKAATSYEGRQNAVSDISRAMKYMAKELGVPVLCLSQLSRSNEKDRSSVRAPRLSDLRDSGAIEQDADVVLFLHSEDYYAAERNETTDPGDVQLLVAKNRHGATGTFHLSWKPEFFLFEDPPVIDRYHEEP